MPCRDCGDEKQPTIYVLEDVRESTKHWNAVFNLLHAGLTCAERYLDAGLPHPGPDYLRPVYERFENLKEKLK